MEFTNLKRMREYREGQAFPVACRRLRDRGPGGPRGPSGALGLEEAGAPPKKGRGPEEALPFPE